MRYRNDRAFLNLWFAKPMVWQTGRLSRKRRKKSRKQRKRRRQLRQLQTRRRKPRESRVQTTGSPYHEFREIPEMIVSQYHTIWGHQGLQDAFEYSAFEASKLVFAKTLLLKNYHCRQGFLFLPALLQKLVGEFFLFWGGPCRC